MLTQTVRVTVGSIPIRGKSRPRDDEDDKANNATAISMCAGVVSLVAHTKWPKNGTIFVRLNFINLLFKTFYFLANFQDVTVTIDNN